jgi:hypothetical protein
MDITHDTKRIKRINAFVFQRGVTEDCNFEIDEDDYRVVDIYITYYYFIVAASLLLTVLERLQVNGRPVTVLHYCTVLIKDYLLSRTSNPITEGSVTRYQWQYKQYIA